MALRGPDDEGVEVGETGGRSAVFGNRRLAIVDPRSVGHQPMIDPQRGNIVTFNGMIFNFRELRRQLEGHGEHFMSDCDTEVVLRAYGVFGKRCVRMLHGMFGFAIWDAAAGLTVIARDRFGIKPLYFSNSAEGLSFCSQMRPLFASGLNSARVDAKGVASFLRWGAAIEPQTCVEGIRSLQAGHMMIVRGKQITLDRYWEPPTPTDGPISRPDVVAELRERLEAAMESHLVSDAPLGVFLSGGIDSSVLACLASQRTRALSTVSVVFDDALSERHHMAAVADTLSTDQNFINLDAATLLRWSRDAIQAMDQPTFDAVNTFVVSRATHQLGMKVALSGLGADELFDGYGHAHRLRLLEKAARLPAPLRHLGARGLGVSGRGSARKSAAWLRDPKDRFGAYAKIRELNGDAEISRLLLHSSELESLDEGSGIERSSLNALSVYDMSFYMRNVLLRDTDSMSMANSLEVRVPFLDDGLAEWVLRLPDEAKAGPPKALLIDAVRDLLPAATLARPKQGFTLPFERWLRGPMRDEVEERLEEPVPSLEGIVSHRDVGRAWRAFLAGQTNWTRPWALYVLYRWAASL